MCILHIANKQCCFTMIWEVQKHKGTPGDIKYFSFCLLQKINTEKQTLSHCLPLTCTHPLHRSERTLNTNYSKNTSINNHDFDWKTKYTLHLISLTLCASMCSGTLSWHIERWVFKGTSCKLLEEINVVQCMFSQIYEASHDLRSLSFVLKILAIFFLH